MGSIACYGGLFFRQYGSVIQSIKRVEPLYADLAIVFHWQPSEIDQLTFDELLNFRALAIERHQQEESKGS
ncbi:GpE family phage tail protein [Vibrio clamense]|uniref:GpE family phage tail protein n=1 Tax=Vibrio clamense TaxID=2910254 RepID=UPI003D25E8D1